jgi:signal transduction histidine kinase
MDKFTSQEKDLYKIIATDSLLSHLPGHIYWKNKQGIFLSCNDEQARYFGFNDPSDIIGKANFDLVDQETAIKITEADRKVIETGEAQILEEVLYGSQYFLSKKIPLRDFKGDIVGVLGTSIDVTDQKLGATLKQRVHVLAVALEAKERFLRNISHEIRTPLQAIVSITETLKRSYDSLVDQDRKRCIDLLVDSNKRLMSLMSNLLDLSKFKKGKFVMNFKKGNIENTIKNVINEFRYTHGQIFLSVDKDVVPNFIYDDFRIAQVVRNLIHNSIKYGSDEKSIYITVSKYKYKNKKYVKVTIKDGGIGIPINERDLIFDAFVEGSRTQSFAGGTGLGLSIAKEIVEAHKGRIWVEDLEEKESGSKISFIIQEHSR